MFSSKKLTAGVAMGAALAFAMACGGSAFKGETGPAGAAAPTPATPTILYTSTVGKVEIKGVSIDTTTHLTKVQFTVADANGIKISTGVTESNFRFTLAKLMPPASSGDTNRWQSYVNRTRSTTATSAVKYDAVSQATSMSGNSSNLKHVGSPDGTWEYTFDQGFDIEKVTKPVAVTYDPTARHRVAMQITGLLSNPSYDFRPDGKAMDQTRDIVTVANCNDCHTQLALHGGYRVDTEYCVVCHNPGTKGVSKNNDHQVELDLQSMVHKIHSGNVLPSNITYSTSSSGSGNYTIVGFNDTVYDYSQINFPWNFPYYSKSSDRKMMDCTACHRSGTKTGDYANYKNKPTKEACVSCHDQNLDFASGSGHGGGAQIDNSKCATCHTPANIEAKHVTLAREPLDLAKEMQIEIVSASNIVAGHNAIVTYKMTNPKTGAYYDLTQTTAAAITPSNIFNIKIAWKSSTTAGDWDNAGAPWTSSTPLPQPISLASNVGKANGDGTWTMTFSTNIDPSARNGGIMAIYADGHPTRIMNGSNTNIPVKTPIKYFNIVTETGNSFNANIPAVVATVGRRSIVSDDKCNKCHGIVSLHGANRSGSAQVCATCHTPALADSEFRRTGGTTWRLDGNSAMVMTSAANLDGKSGESVDMKTLIHGIHAGELRGSSAPYTVYRIQTGNKNLYRFTEAIPGKAERCDICHEGTTYTLPLNAKMVGSSNVTNPTGASASTSAQDPSDDIKLSPAASVCSGCHASTNAKSHMIKNGAEFNLSGGNTHMESCDVCHGSGKDADVKKAHGL